MKKALITGITGQDGSYLAELLLEKGYEVHGIIRRASTINTWRVNHLIDDPAVYNKKLFLHYGDMTDMTSLMGLLKAIEPDEVYNLAAQSHVKVSFEIPIVTADTDALGTLKILESIRLLGLEKRTRFYQASTSELYGKVLETPQRETTPFYPRSPYGVAKLYSFWIVKNYREAYGMYACNGILFNHESERRGITFVTRKISIGLAKVKLGKQERLVVGNLDAKRDWGYAPEYVEAMWRMLPQPEPKDYVIATGETHTVREFIDCAAKEIGLDIEWKGKGINEKGYDRKTKKVVVEVSERYFRPTEVEQLCGDPSKARKELGWQAKTKFAELVRLMAKADLEKVRKEEVVY